MLGKKWGLPHDHTYVMDVQCGDSRNYCIRFAGLAWWRAVEVKKQYYLAEYKDQPALRLLGRSDDVLHRVRWVWGNCVCGKDARTGLDVCCKLSTLHVFAKYLNTFTLRFTLDLALRKIYIWVPRRTKTPNVPPNALVLIQDDNIPPMKWQMGRVIDTVKGNDDVVRVAIIKTSTGVTRRAITKLCLLPVDDVKSFQGSQRGEDVQGLT